MIKNFDIDTNWIFTFCKTCWDFKKFIFESNINFDESEPTNGKCFSCKNIQRINFSEVKDYYLNLNNKNN
ncbi:hypothetical protein SLITO_v1c08930 [Spiroplasma litorale]|uniref:Uncharacterized protein n=1 Tax=Spiroplasma litorale TaxID=216942 RepID=A0A0K1W335_9MOLU|nr:hypothetical protein [Spiroplasma litorale]AKX34507.1 hypothetical protein SLITO_v1c08930 [Spiroplasma litorale]